MFPVCLPEGGASDHSVLTRSHKSADPFANPVKPRPAILIGQSNPLGHFDYVGSGMEVVSLEKWPAQVLGKKLADGGLTSARDAH